ncbi:TPA: haloacid dehalogenase, partial [Candidatus Acetothermia bacterium]|nr:haloacid dehalogenase [Candidatus Acetothermia bacterium]
PHYFAWVEDPNSLLSDSGLKKALTEAPSPTARQEFEVVLAWSERVNWAIKEIVKGIPPFPFVRETLQALEGRADVIVVSATPVETLEREWAEHDLARYTALILGQEMGTKSQHLSASRTHYPPGHVLMVGDAPGDLQAAQDTEVLFYPIVPGEEIASWERLYREELHRFLSGAYAHDHEKGLVDRFEQALPERPPWEVQ